MGGDYKILLIMTLVVGYALSKFSGIKIIAEMPPQRRIAAMLTCIALAEGALVLFALVPPPSNFVFLLLNGLPLGLIWGIVFSFLEGRRSTELLGATLCVSFIVSSGVVKSVGKALMRHAGVSEFWMPAATGLAFTGPLLVAVWLRSRTPAPSLQDHQLRTRRIPMSAAQRSAFFRRFALGIVLLVTLYASLNTYRDFRDNFAVELWTALGYRDAPTIFTLSEVPVAVVTLAAIGSLIVIRDNRWAFWIGLSTVFCGAVLNGMSTAGFQAGRVHPALWMIAVGMGLYVPYIAFHVMVFERMIALFRHESNIGYLMYLADACGYLGSCLVLLYRNFGAPRMSWLDFFIAGSYAMAFLNVLLGLVAVAYFRQRLAEATLPSTCTAHAPIA